MSQITFTSLADRLAASGVQEQATVQGHTLQIGNDITVDFKQLTAQRVAAPATKAKENVRIDHARDSMQSSAKTMVESLVALGARSGNRASMVGTLLSKMWESAIHQQRLYDLYRLNPNMRVFQAIVSSPTAKIRTGDAVYNVHVDNLQQEQFDLLVYRLSDQDMVNLYKAASSDIMDALDESLAELGKSTDAAMAQNIRSLHDSFQKLRLAVMTEASTRLDVYGRKPENREQYQKLQATLADIHERNGERLKKGELFVQEREKAQCQSEVESLAPQLQAALAEPGLELNERQQQELMIASKSLYLQGRNSLHAQARQALMDEGHEQISAEDVHSKARHLYCTKLCASMAKPSDCEKSIGFRSALFSTEVAYVQYSLCSSLQDTLAKHPALQPFANMLYTVAQKNPDLMREELTFEIDTLRALLQGDTTKAEVIKELCSGFQPNTERDLAEVALVRASMNLLRKSWMAVRNMGESPMQPEVWSCLLNCAGKALHVQGLRATDVARLMPLALQKATSILAQLRELIQRSGDAPLSGLKHLVAQCTEGIPNLTAKEKNVVASAVMGLAEAMLAQKPEDALPVQSPNQRLTALASEVNKSPAFTESTALMGAAVREHTEAETAFKAAEGTVRALIEALKGYDFGVQQAAEIDLTRTHMTAQIATLKEQLHKAQQQEALVAKDRQNIDADVRDLNAQFMDHAGKIQWASLREKLDKPDSKYTVDWMLALAHQGRAGYQSLSTEEQAIYDTMLTICNAPPTRAEMDAVHIDKKNQHNIQILLADQAEIALKHADVVGVVDDLKNRITKTEHRIQELRQEGGEQLLRSQFMGRQLEMAHEAALHKLEAAKLTLMQKKDKLDTQQDVVYKMVWCKPTNFGKLVPTGTPIKARYDLAQQQHDNTELALAPLRQRTHQAQTALEAIRTTIKTNEAAYAQSLDKAQTELAMLQEENANLRQRANTLQEQHVQLLNARDSIHDAVHHNEVEKQQQFEQLLAISKATLGQKQEELAILNTQTDTVRNNVVSMQKTLQQGTRSIEDCRKWVADEVQHYAALEAQASQTCTDVGDEFSTIATFVDSTQQDLKDLCHLPLGDEPIISSTATARTLKKIHTAQHKAVSLAIENFNTQVQNWIGVRSDERQLFALCDGAAHNLATEHSRMAALRAEQLHLFVAQDAQQPWQGEGPRPQNIAERLHTVQLAIQSCTDTITAYTTVLMNFRNKLTACEHEAAGIVTAMETIAMRLPDATAAKDMAGLGSRYIKYRHDGGKLRHKKLVADVELVQHRHQPAYANTVLQLLNAAEARGVQDAFLNLLAASETQISPQRIDAAQAQLEILDKQHKNLTRDIGQQTAFITEYEAILADPHHGVDQRSLSRADQAVQENAQELEDTAATLQSNSAAQAPLTEQLLDMVNTREHAAAQELEALQEATTALYEAHRELLQHESDVASAEEEWKNLSRLYDNYISLVKSGQPVTDSQRLEVKLNDTACLHMAEQEALPLNNDHKIELSRINAALVDKAYPASPENQRIPLMLLHDSLPIPRELLQADMLAEIVEETDDHMLEVVNAMLKHDENLLPWKELFQRMNAEAAENDSHPLTNAFHSQINTIMGDARSMPPTQWKLTYGESCSVESLVRLACLRAMRGTINTIETSAALQSEDLTLLLQGYSLDAIRKLREEAQAAPLSVREKYASMGHYLATLTRPAIELPQTVRNAAWEELQTLTPLLCEFYFALRSDPPYAFRSRLDVGGMPPKTHFELDGIIRFHQQAKNTLGTLILPEKVRDGRPEHTDNALCSVANLVKKYHQLSSDDSTLFGPLRPNFTGALRPMLLNAPATSLALFEKLSAKNVAGTLNSQAFLNFAGHVLHLWREETANNVDIPQLTLLASRINDILTMRDALNKELGEHANPVPQFTYALKNIPQSVRAALTSITLPTNYNKTPDAPATELTAKPRYVCPRLDISVTNEGRAAFLNACCQELTAQQREHNIRATLYGAVLCSMVRATGSEVDENMVFHALAGHGLPEDKKGPLLTASHMQPLSIHYRSLMSNFMDDDVQSPAVATQPSLEEEVIRATLKLEKGLLTTQDASLIDFALPAHTESHAAQHILDGLLQERAHLHKMSDPCQNTPAQFAALRSEELLAGALLPDAHTVAQMVGDFDTFRERVANKMPLPLSDIPNFNKKYNELYKMTQAQLDKHTRRLASNAGFATYLGDLLRSNAPLLPQLSVHADTLRGVL